MEHNNKLNIVLGSDVEENPFRNRTYRCCIDIGEDEFGLHVQVRYDSFLYTDKGIRNYGNEDVSNDSYILEMMQPLRQFRGDG